MHHLAYIDPGVGLLAWQAIVAAFVGLLFYLEKTRRAIVRFFQWVVRAVRREGSEVAGSTRGPNNET